MRIGEFSTRVLFAVAIVAACLCDPRSAVAQREPVIVVPGRAGIPVMIWGQDVSGAVIEGDFGLDRPGNGAGLTIIRPIGPYYRGIPPERPLEGYYPTTGNRPAVGRDEVVPPADRPLPPPAATFRRSWTSESPNLPATIGPPGVLPPMILAPQINEQQPRPSPAPNPGPEPLPLHP
jgi:hypothetical protein